MRGLNNPAMVAGLAALAMTTAALAASATPGASDAPTIQITQVPPCGGGPDQMARIGGTATGAVPSGHRIVLFARTDQWYVQPYTAAPYTTIGRDGGWSSPTHLGQEYAALLATYSYRPPTTTLALPELGSEFLAVDIAPCDIR